MRRTAITRLALFLAVALSHGALILFFAVQVDAARLAVEQPVEVMKLMDIIEDIPLPPPAPPPPKEPPPPQPANAVESIAETMVETEEVPEDQVVVDPGTLTVSQAPVPVRPVRDAGEDYLPMNRISVPPVFNERDIRRSLVYPPIALRAGIEGTVYLELFIDSKGSVQQIAVLKETPPDRGFGDAAKAAFAGIRCSPAQANGSPVAVRYRYPVRFALKG